MNSIHRHRTAVVTAASAAALAPLAFVPTAFAADVYDCGDPNAQQVGMGICWAYPDSFSGTFSAPEGVETISVLLVGGSGGSYLSGDGKTAFGGGGGEGIVYDSVPATAPLTFTVGKGGHYDDGVAVHGEDTSISGYDPARGGKTATDAGPGASGNGNAGVKNTNVANELNTFTVGGGGGIGGSPSSSSIFPDAGAGGPGSSLASLDSPLFAPEVFEALLESYGATPEQAAEYAASVRFGAGGSVFLGDYPEVDGMGGSYGTAGGGVRFLDDESNSPQDQYGSDGSITFAWYAEGYGPTDEGDDSSNNGALPETGSPVKPWTVAGALGAMLAGAVALTRRRERV